jgi:hypothetical protein
MGVREIPPPEWPDYLVRFSRLHRAWLATVDREGPVAGRHLQVLDRPLGEVTADVSGRRVIRISIGFEEDSHAGGVRVDAPSKLRVDEGADGATRALEIEDESGARTRIRFRAAEPPEPPDDVPPGGL